MEEKELFHDYELKNWELSPRIYKIIGAAVAVHLFAFAVVAQFNLFGTKACDSPYVNKVCQVLDTAYMASVFLGTDMEFSSRDYEKTEIEEADITYIDVSDQFTYPAGYFEVANPEQPPTDLALMPGGTTDFSAGNFSGYTTTPLPPTALDTSKPAILPTPNPNPIDGTLPNSPLGDNPIATTPKNIPRVPIPSNRPPRRPKNNNPNNPPNKLPSDEELAKQNENNNANSNATAQNEKPKDENANAEENKLFNKKPLEDFGEKYGQAILNKEVDINAPFAIEVKGNLDENGKIVKPVMTVKPGSDEKMTEVAKEAIAAFADSQLLRTLYEAGVRGVTITFSQDQSNLMAIIQSDAGTPNKAGSIQSSVSLARKLALATMKPESDEAKLISRAEFSTQGKIFILNFLIPNEEKAPMIEKNLRSLQEKLKNKQPNSGVAETKGKTVTTVK
jgi:hypothetical protein